MTNGNDMTGDSAAEALTAASMEPVASAGRELRITLPFGITALAAAAASLLACYGVVFATAVLGFEAILLNPDVHAVLMWSFALLTVVALWRNRRRHHSNIPFVVGTLALATLIFTLYGFYAIEVEIIAYVLLMVAAMLNQNVFLGSLNRTVQRQANEIRQLNRALAKKVELQGGEIDRLGRLRQFLAPQVADLVVSQNKDSLLETHRRYIACVFCDIRDFTAVSESIEPEEVIAILQAYHDRIGALVTEHGGTIGYRAGDGLMVFFNDPIPCDEPVFAAVRLALDIRKAFADIQAPWAKLGHVVGLGIGIASGYATLGLVGFEGRADYTAIGSVVNIASRLCDRAVDGQILLNQRAHVDVEALVVAKPLGAVELKGVRLPVDIYALDHLKTPVHAQAIGLAR